MGPGFSHLAGVLQVGVASLGMGTYIFMQPPEYRQGASQFHHHASPVKSHSSSQQELQV